jgi:acyl dehydratase
MRAGEVVARLVVEEVPAAAMKTMAALLDDPTPIHYDAAAVRALGIGERPVNQGPTNVGYLVELAVRAAGGHDGLRKISVRLRDKAFVGDRLECEASVLSVDETSGLVELELSGRVGDRLVMSGRASVAPSPGGGPVIGRSRRG